MTAQTRTKQVAAPAAPTTPWSFAGRSRPEKLIQSVRALTALSSRLSSSYRRRRNTALLLTIAWILAVFNICGAQSEVFAAACRQLTYLTLFVVLVAYNLRTLVRRTRIGAAVRGITGGGIFVLLLCLASYALRTNLELNFSGELGISGAALEVLRWLPNAPFSLEQQALLLTLGALQAAAIVCWANTLRLKGFRAQSAGVAFSAPIITALLSEAPPNSRCSVGMNTVPESWTEYEIRASKSGKPAHVNPIFEATIDLGSQRRFAISAVHIHRSKGQRKHKGWKHKVKVKFTLHNEQTVPNAFVSQAVNEAIQGKLKQVPTDDGSPWKFVRDINPRHIKVSTQQDNLSVVYTLPGPVLMSNALDASLLPHPAAVLMICQVMCDAWNKEKPGA